MDQEYEEWMEKNKAKSEAFLKNFPKIGVLADFLREQNYTSFPTSRELAPVVIERFCSSERFNFSELENLASHLDVAIHFSDEEEFIDNGVINAKGIILHPETEIKRQTFVMAHELGHLFLYAAHIAYGFSARSSSGNEDYINSLANNLIFPDSLIKKLDLELKTGDIIELFSIAQK